MGLFSSIVSFFDSTTQETHRLHRFFFLYLGNDYSYMYEKQTEFYRLHLDILTQEHQILCRIDRTITPFGKETLFKRIQTLRGRDDAEAFGLRTDWFGSRKELTERCIHHLERLADVNLNKLQDLVFDEPERMHQMPGVYALTATAVFALAAAILFHPLFLLLFAAVFVCNLILCIHLGALRNTTLMRQLAWAVRTSRKLAAEDVPGTSEVREALEQIDRVERRCRFAGGPGKGNSRLSAICWISLELLKICFNIQIILFHRIIGSIANRRKEIFDIMRFIGETDAAISVMRLRQEVPTCRPTFTEGKCLYAEEVVHPLVANCVPNTLKLDGKGMLLYGSNSSGKTTLLRTLMINAVLAETFGFCFAARWEAPYMKLYDSFSQDDPTGYPSDFDDGIIYGSNEPGYMQKVREVDRLLEEADRTTPCLFVLDELFKGINPTERIAFAKVVLARLNRGPHLVLCATHDIELADLLREDGFSLYHFREQVDGSRLVFDYRLHTGPHTTCNTIRLLSSFFYAFSDELIDELIDEAQDVHQRLLEKTS